MFTERPDLSVNGWNAEFIESMYDRWLTQPDALEEEWQQFFKGFDLAARSMPDPTESSNGSSAATPTRTNVGGKLSSAGIDVAHTDQGKVDSLIYHYRDIGHLAAQLDPLGTERPFPEHLTLESFGLTDADLDKMFDPGHLPIDNPAPLSTIIEVLEDTYCRSIGVEYMHIQDREVRRWLQKRMETVRNNPRIEKEHKLRVLKNLRKAWSLEAFLELRFKGKKWFSLAGAESLIPLFNEIIELGPRNGVEEFACGMAHRGRINVLVNTFGKTYQELFTEFAEAWEDDYVEGGGDVKYHRGYSSDYITDGGQKVHLTMASNPSHLEFVYPVVLGRCRAKQRLKHNEESRDRVVPVLVHGDASFPAQGIVAECLNMVDLDGYTVGGTIHIIVNNQVGFTTDQIDARSGRYCTDIAKMIDAPIFHVNGDDPEACAFVARLALEYRQAFKNDVVIDMWCFRKFGHNESDEPAFTQPKLYERVRKHRPVIDIYAERLRKEGVISQDEIDSARADLKDELDSAQTAAKEQPVDPTPDPFKSIWEGLHGDYSFDYFDTGVNLDTLKEISKALGKLPKDFSPHRKLKKLLDERGSAVADDAPLNWAMGELLAYGSLLLEGHAVRFTGQDVERGTFSHRHGVIIDQQTGQPYTSLNHIAKDQAKFCIHNSPLSEQSCVGYEYGYSLTDPKMLIIWEAQFGDFCNGAQVIIDQFIASAEIKWHRHSGLVLLLPHGYEGQGPEHSSARLERFLQLCADDNMIVINPTTPAQIFHALRRQIKQGFRKPLIVMSPKSLLRHKQAVSTAQDMAEGGFEFIIDDATKSTARKAKKVERVIFCSGKIYYELLAARAEEQRDDDVAIVRVEQLYPFPFTQMEDILSRYETASELLWVQEEPLNAGAFRFIDATMRDELGIELLYVGREASSTPAVGASSIHAEEQAEILQTAFGPLEEVEEEGEIETGPQDEDDIDESVKEKATVAE